LKCVFRNFEEIQSVSQNFVKWANGKQSHNCDTNIFFNETLTATRVKKMEKNSYDSLDDSMRDPLLLYKINMFNVIMDTNTNSVERRFEKRGLILCADFSCLDPKMFSVNSETIFNYIN